jgi:beta-N-acetylhexosaminidase
VLRGAVISADLVAATAATGGTVGQAAVDALRAGCDLLLVPGDRADQQAAYRAVVRAVRRGVVPQERYREALARVSALKRLRRAR